ncbi:EAL domain-containing protein [Clostridium sp. DSM 100503]|uniref:EAL domain-containing protein n=1 Tax=Clostridium sp. DSM 100503 TaxID=2963282 RepID=UPI00214A52D2|nr:EAL domain-containing protein [Clostridium sp. DSM 100503]MCR1950659.1 EAL domain-containing protein [Clostridium sp. DSM 100503]
MDKILFSGEYTLFLFLILIIALVLVARLILNYIFKCDCKSGTKKEYKSNTENIMYNAIQNREFEMYLQQKYDLQNECIVGAECLVRWNTKSNGTISPNNFIHIFEKNGFIVNLDIYMFEEVCKIINRWENNNYKVIPLSVNISRFTLSQGDYFMERVKKLIEAYNINTNLIEIEITESAMLEDSNDIINVLNDIRNLGIKISLDDFGAGYSSLNILKSLPLDAIKLDKLFLDKKTISSKGSVVLKNIIKLAKELNLGIIAEGVEFREQAMFLKSIGCTIVQGYLYGKPVKLSEFEKNQFISNS